MPRREKRAIRRALRAIAAWLRPALESLRPPSRKPIWTWGEENYMVPGGALAGPWRLENSPQVREVLEWFPNDRVRVIVVLCAAQASKTETMILCVCWTICEDPAGAMWVTANKEQADLDMIERIWPAFHACAPLAKLLPTGSRSKRKNREVHFTAGVFEAGGANSKVFLQSRSRRWLFLDEVRNWRKWSLPMVLKRVSMWWNSRVFIATTPGIEKDPPHREFLKGSQHHLHVQCPQCGRAVADIQHFKFKKGDQLTPWYQAEHDGGFEWDTNETTKPGGMWDFDELAKTIVYRWPCCGGVSRDTPDERQRIAESGKMVAHNPKAPEHRKSATWSAMINPKGRSWADCVEEFITASHALRMGDIEPYKAFITETCGLPWSDKHRSPPDENALEGCKDSYNSCEPWEEEARRFFIFDVQKTSPRFRWGIIAYSATGASRRICFGECASEEELIIIRDAFGCTAANTMCDTGHDAKIVYRMLLASGEMPLTGTVWKGTKGEKADHYVVGKIQQPWRFSEWIDPYHGTSEAGTSRPIRVLLFAKEKLLARLKDAQNATAREWRMPRRFSAPPGLPGRILSIDEYIAQVTAYEEVEETDARGVVTRRWHCRRPGNDHATSLEMMGIVGAMACGLFSAPIAPPRKPPSEDTSDPFAREGDD